MIHLFVKFGAIFLGGVAFTLAILMFLPAIRILPSFEDNAGLVGQKVQERVQDKGKQQADSFVSSLGQVLSSVAENPAWGPLLKTKKDVEQTIKEVKSLPDEQRNAICQQICLQ